MNQRATPRSKIEELKTLIRIRPRTGKKAVNLNTTITTTISNILANSDRNPTNNTLIISKPSMALHSLGKSIGNRNPRAYRGIPTFNLANVTLNSSLNSSASTSTRIPKPPSKPKETQFIRKVSQNTQESGKPQLPITPSYAIQHYKSDFTNYEIGEILGFNEIYYWGGKIAKVVNQGPNHGFDDAKANYLLYKHDHLAYRYEILKVLGKGSFGQVCECFDHKNNESVAMKIIKNKKQFLPQSAVELKVLKTIMEEDSDNSNNVIHVKDYFIFRHHLCISMELLSSNLYDLLKQTQFKGLSLGLIRRFAIQILIALKFTKKLKLIHCDLKPENILLKQANKSGIKVIDFGSACFESERAYSYIQSRFYRAPEVILGIPYGMEIDIWSFGCILAELYTGNPIFPGESEAEQLQIIMSYLGVPPSTLLSRAPRARIFFDGEVPRLVPNSKGKTYAPSSKSILKSIITKDSQFLDLIQRCFEWDPNKRITPEEALLHPWITSGLTKTRPPDEARRHRPNLIKESLKNIMIEID
ncbi:unnamed protein product [Blepharisma stoltei]|uniref:dual-specificity kinase n=1 Tax=Blepharisma stoltei TaxID=1481888 RepID=A0AAU9IMF7_9CILI|nr:unnamed protein product [Blepharisma stoltei]